MTKRRVRVTYVIRQLGRGGSERRLYQFLKQLYRTDIEPQVITFEGGAYEAQLRDLGIPVVNLRDSARRGLTRFRAVTSHIRRFQPDIVHGMDSGGFYGRTAAWFVGVPVLFSGFNGSHLPSRAQGWIEYALSGFTDYIVSNSYAGERCLIQNVGVDPQRVRVIPNGFDFESANACKPINLHEVLGLNPAQPIVGQVARLMAIKNPRLFIDAATAVHREAPEAHFVMVGDGPLRPEVESLIRARGLGGTVTLLGEREDAMSLVPSFSIGVLTSRAEGLPNALLEYMFWSRPSVVTDVGDCSRVITHGESGYVFPPSDADRLSELLLDLLRNPGKADQFGRAAREYLEQHLSLPRYCESLLGLYFEALDGHQPNGKRAKPAPCVSA